MKEKWPSYYVLVGRAPMAVDMMTWATALEGRFGKAVDPWRVAHTVIDADLGVYVSTVFLGLDHSFGSGDPVLFETMTFAPAAISLPTLGREIERDEFDGGFNRYCTYAEAERGHAEIVAAMKVRVARIKEQVANVTARERHNKNK